MLAKHPECDILLQLSFFNSQEDSVKKILEMEFLKSIWLQSHVTYLRVF